jgi:hypothetical protein
MYIADTFNVGELVVKIIPDDDRESPRDWDNLGTMVCWHRRYNLGDGKPDCEPSEFNPKEHAVCLPLYLYDHSGITMRTGPFGCPWDSGQVGWIYIDADKIRKEYSVKRISKKLLARVASYLESEVKVYDQFLTGDVYGFTVETEDGEDVDSCWGFYGMDEARNAGRESAEGWNKEHAKVDSLQLEANA